MRTLGGSGLVISELALGTMVFGEEGPRGTAPEDAEKIIHRYLDAGGNHIDTANVYAGGRSEEVVGKALEGRHDDVVLATKVRFPMGPGPNDQGLSRAHVLRSVEDSLRRLRADHVDLLYMHCWDPLTPIDGSLLAFDDLVAAGKVRYIGVSNFKAWQLMGALARSDALGWVRFIAAQYQYSLITRDIEDEFTDLCLTEGAGIVPWGPLGGGFLSGKYEPGDKPDSGRLAVMGDEAEEAWGRRNLDRNWSIVAAASAMAADLGASIPQVALGWLLTRPAVDSVILGVRTAEQLDDNLGPAALDEEQTARLDAVSAPAERYPYRFIADYGARPQD